MISIRNTLFSRASGAAPRRLTHVVPRRILHRTIVHAPARACAKNTKDTYQEPLLFSSGPFSTIQRIPVIDLDDPLPKVALQVDQAATHYGFFHVVNHGVPRELQRAMFAYMEAFFRLPLEAKKKYGMNSSSPFRGYFAELQEKLDFEEDLINYKGDLKEGYDCGFDSKNSIDFFGPNQWPGIPPGFEGVAKAYLREMEVYCGRLMRVFALALGRPVDFFDGQITDPLSTLRLLHYRPTSEGSRGCAAHTDYGTCTALLQDEVGGLQIKLPDGRWIDVDPLEDSYVTNLGDMLQYWSGRRWRSTVHRVVNDTPQDRYSIPFFYNPNRDTEITPLDKGRSIFDGPAKTCEGILAARYRRSQIFPADGIG